MKASEVKGRLGETRSVLRAAYLLHTPDSFVRAPFPGVAGGVAIVHASSQLGARFLQYTAELEAGGTLESVDEQQFVWVLEGEVSLRLDGHRHVLKPGGYVYAGHGSVLTAETPARLAVIEKRYEGIDGVMQPSSFVGHEPSVKAVALDGDEGVMVRALLPADPAFDFAVNTLTYAAGAQLAQVEVHVMEHGLLMLDGAGLYRLDEDRHQVETGDFIWMAAFCPQWFETSADGPAKYLIYKDWNRRPAL